MAKTSAYQQAKKLQKRNKEVGKRIVVEGQIEPDYQAIRPEAANYSSLIGHALNFANAAFEDADLKEFAVEHFKESGAEEEGKMLARLPDYQLRKMGKICWLLVNGAQLNEHDENTLYSELARLKDLKTEKAEVAVPTEAVEKRSIQDFVREKAGEFSAKLEEVIDTKAFSLDIYKWLQKEEVKGGHIPFIMAHFKPWADEIKEAESLKRKANKSDLELQLVEAYSASEKKQNDFILRLMHELGLYANSQKAQRKPRKKAAKSADKVVAKMNYKSNDSEFKIASISPENILGSEQLWTFNTKTRQLQLYKAQDAAGLLVKGTTILNFSDTESMGKTIRKPADVLPKIMNGGKVYLRKALDEINSKGKKLTGRINGDIILLRTA